jgi:hypothetical protein
MVTVLEYLAKPNRRVLAMAGALGAAAIIYYFLADHEMLFEEPRRATTRWALGIMAFLVPMVFSRWVSPLASAAALLSGVVVAGTTWMFITGPGNLWPIAIAFMVAFVAPPIGVGALLALIALLAMRVIRDRASGNG